MLKQVCYFALLLTILVSPNLYAQSTGSINGKITEQYSKKPLEFVNVVLRNVLDSTIVAQEVTNTKGLFNLSGIPYGSYFAQASFVGNEDIKTAVFNIDTRNQKVTLNLIMTGSEKILSEVQVNAKKELYSSAIDRKVYNVDLDLMAKSGSASEILQNVPLVQVDIDGNVSLRNSAVTILINGKISPLMGKNAAVVLQQLPAGSIEKIEVITNPSAKYKPDGVGGIINIVLKKNTKRGLNQNITANIGNDERYNANTIINYNPGKINLFGSYSIKQDDRRRISTNNRTQQDKNTGSISYHTDNATSKSRPFSNIATLGFDYNLNDENSLGISGNYYLRNMHKHDLIVRQVKNVSGKDQDYDRIRKNFEQEKEGDLTLYYEHTFPKEDHLIRLEFNISHSPENEDNHYTNTYRFPLIANQLENTIIKQISDNKNLNLSYENPLSEHSKLEAGYDGQYNKQDLDFYVATLDPQKQQFVTDISQTNRFIYFENIHAFYGTFSQEFDKFATMIGLRGEYSDINSKLITTNTTLPNHYFKLYPTLHFTYKTTENTEIQLNYSRRVRRPEGDDLNPFAEYSDPNNVRVGNPYLLPEIIHSVETGYLWKVGKINLLPGIYYRYTYNRFTSITEPLNDSVLITRKENLAKDQAIGGDIILSGNINDKLNLSFTPTVFYNQIDASNLGYSTKKSTITWSSNLNASYALSKAASLQVNSNYRSSRLTPQGKYLPSFVMNFGIRQEIFNKKGSIYLTVSDLLKSQREEAKLQGPFLTQHILTKKTSRMMYLGLSYTLGTMKKQKDLQFDNSL